MKIVDELVKGIMSWLQSFVFHKAKMRSKLVINMQYFRRTQLTEQKRILSQIIWELKIK